MEAVGQDALAAVLTRDLAISRGLCAVDALLLALHVWEVRNFELWEQARWAEGVPAQDQVREEEQALGARGPETSDYMLRTLRALVE